MIDHLVATHLPLKCNKCKKLYEKSEDFVEFDLCYNHRKMKKSPNNNKENVEPPSLETIPEINLSNSLNKMHRNKTLSESDYKSVEEYNDSRHLNESVRGEGLNGQHGGLKRQNSTPNMNYGGSDSGLSMQNFSSIDRLSQLSSSGRLQSPRPKKSKLVRSTSTPMQPFLFDFKKPASSFHNSSGSYMSSIHGGGGVSRTPSSLVTTDNENSPPMSHTTNNSGHSDISSSGISFVIQKATIPKGRNKMVANTPLRQVMSKSIQRAIVQHGIKNIHEIRVKPKLSFNSQSSSDSSGGESCRSTDSIAPLDLRTTPVLRRCLSTPVMMLPDTIKNLPYDAVKSSSVAITPPSLGGDTKDSVHSVESLLYTTCPNHSDELMTPRNVTNIGNIKKTISFEFRPPIESMTLGSDGDVPVESVGASDHLQKSQSEVWYTPETTVSYCAPERSLSCSAITERKRNLLGAFDEQITAIDNDSDDVFYTEENTSDEKNSRSDKKSKFGSRKIWSLVTSVRKMASLIGNTSRKNKSNETTEDLVAGEQSLLKRYTSFSGWMNSTEVKKQSSYGEEPFSKRRKTSTGISEQLLEPSSSGSECSSGASAVGEGEFRRKKVQGRMPIRSNIN